MHHTTGFVDITAWIYLLGVVCAAALGLSHSVRKELNEENRYLRPFLWTCLVLSSLVLFADVFRLFKVTGLMQGIWTIPYFSLALSAAFVVPVMLYQGFISLGALLCKWAVKGDDSTH